MFTFNFKKSPFSKYLVKVGCVTLFAGISLIALNSVSKNNDTTRLKEVAKVLNHTEDHDVAIFGPSYMMVGVLPEMFDCKVANLCFSWSGLNVDLELAKKYLENHNPKVVLLDGSILYHKGRNGQEWISSQKLNFYLGIYAPESIEDMLPLSIPLKGEKTLKKDTSKITEDDEMRHAKFFFEKPSTKYFENKQLLKLHQNYSSDHSTENLNELKKFIELCDSRDIDLVFVSAPKHKSYNSEFGENHYAERDQFINSLEGVDFMNFEKSFENKVDYFHDFNHLNYEGAKAFTNLLNKKIASI